MQFNCYIPFIKSNLPVLMISLPYIKKNISPKKIILIGNDSLLSDVQKLASYTGVDYLDFISEDELYKGLTLTEIRKLILARVSDAHRAGWYFQQFLKMALCYVDENENYVTMDADTIPLNPIKYNNGEQLLFSAKIEYHKPYFETMERLFDGKVKRKVDYSFIAENMVFNCNIMKELIEVIETNENITGVRFYEKIIAAIEDKQLTYVGFSEFETYGNYVMEYHKNRYNTRHLRTARDAGKAIGGIFLHGGELPNQILEWVAKDFDLISLERIDQLAMPWIILAKIISIKIIRRKISCRKIMRMVEWLRIIKAKLMKTDPPLMFDDF